MGEQPATMHGIHQPTAMHVAGGVAPTAPRTLCYRLPIPVVRRCGA